MAQQQLSRSRWVFSSLAQRSSSFESTREPQENCVARVNKPIRVLQVHSDLHWGGVERWLLQVSRAIDRSAFQFDFFAASVDPDWRAAMQSMQLGLIPSPRPRRLWRYTTSLRDILRKRPRYDAIHCHFIDHSGILLREAAKAGVPLRIAH